MDVLYHYCSSQVFHAIVDTNSIRLSSLLQSNDSTEGRLAADAMKRLAAADGLDDVAIRRILEDMDLLVRMYDGLGFCMSEESDLLSQWRGYGDDGQGFSIGFSAEYIRRICAAPASVKTGGMYLAQVEYEQTQHDQAMRKYYEGARDPLRSSDWRPLVPGTMAYAVNSNDPEWQRKAFESNFEIGTKLSAALDQVFRLKSKAFREEQEWRLLAHIKSHTFVGLSVHPRRDQLVLFRKLELLPLGVEPIVRVLIGPKNRTPKDLVRRFLRGRSLSQVDIDVSSASYR